VRAGSATAAGAAAGSRRSASERRWGEVGAVDPGRARSAPTAVATTLYLPLSLSLTPTAVPDAVAVAVPAAVAGAPDGAMRTARSGVGRSIDPHRNAFLPPPG